MNDKYIPSPVDLSDFTLPCGLEPLMEEIAKNVHEVWARTRMNQGWTYGSERDDRLKQHPCLIPYEQLSEDEKEFDRNTAKTTLALISRLGYRIEK